MSMLDHSTPPVALAKPGQFTTLTVVAIVLMGVSVLWGGVDPRMVDGAPVWMKPLKFSLSFALLFATLALLETRLSAKVRQGWVYWGIGQVMAAAFLAEMAYMMYQGARAEASHFNMSTPFNAFMYTTVMAAGAVALVVGVALIGWLAKRDTDAALSAGLREAVWLGFLASFVLTMIVAGYLSSGTSHFVGVHPEGAATLPLLGWSGVTGDLRPAHFLSLHAMQVLPLLALWLDWRGHQAPLPVIRYAAAGYSFVTLAVFTQALLGFPLVPLG